MKSSKGIKKGEGRGEEGEIISQIRFSRGEEILRLDEAKKTKEKRKENAWNSFFSEYRLQEYR